MVQAIAALLSKWERIEAVVHRHELAATTTALLKAVAVGRCRVCLRPCPMW